MRKARKTAPRTPSGPMTQGRRRVVIEKISPEIDGGRFPVKRSVGESVVVKAHVFADGHEEIVAVLKHRHQSQKRWTETSMRSLGNDVWTAEFQIDELGGVFYTVCARVDPLQTWARDLRRRIEAGQSLGAEFLVGAALIEEAAQRASGGAARRLRAWAKELREGDGSADKVSRALDPDLLALARRFPDKERVAAYPRELEVRVDRRRARFGAWYEMFPRSSSDQPGTHGTLKDCARRLGYVAGMGFDVLYLPPIHPIGRTHRKGPNNALECSEGDPGSPWAIGSPEGGHTAIHPALGTLSDFDELVAAAGKHGMELALDIAFQCSPDHPWATRHPEWFVKRPDGTIRCAENPPKIYQDIYPLDFECADWRGLWDELKGVFLFWIGRGVKIFRVDNPHTKPFDFWEWVIRGIREEHPDVIFLSEAFTRPKIMYRLAKLGFTQSYNYFPWRTAKQELIDYFTELTRTEVREYFRPSLWTNTPDILIAYLQHGGRSAFMIRSVLAGTLGASYGVYGPPFELCESAPREPRSEEYMHSEKYEVRYWNLRDPISIQWLIARVNEIRRKNPALQSDDTLTFHRCDNDQLLVYSKRAEDNLILVAVNLDTRHAQSGWVDLPLAELGIEENRPYELHDLLTDAWYTWNGSRNYVELRHEKVPAHIFRVARS